MIRVVQLSSFPKGANPFCHDAYNMGQDIGTNVCVMFESTSTEKCNYLIVVNTETGERVRVDFNINAAERARAFTRICNAREKVQQSEQEQVLALVDE